jgi:hypothetical protein
MLLQCADLGAWKLRKSWLGIFKNEEDELPWGELPYGGKCQTSFWSMNQAALVMMVIERQQAKRAKLKLNHTP